tara:strand:- start:701 stop:1108 length:408 start_codon:yes stop_codon:yes gene_type:complete
MSVNLTSKETVNAILDMDGVNEMEQRAIWYAYVGNVTAFNLQYEEKEEIDFDFDKKYPNEMHPHIALTELKSLMYNIYTNDGNCFVQQKWIDLMQGVIDRLENERDVKRNEDGVALDSAFKKAGEAAGFDMRGLK